MNTSYTDQKPGLVTAIGVMTLTSGIINLFWGFVASASVLSTIVGVVCLPLTILPTILGVFEIIYAAKLLTTQPQPVQPSTPIAVFQISTLLMGNLFSMVVGILSLIFYNDLIVKDYFARLNSGQTAPASSAPAPVLPEPANPPADTSSAPEMTEEPEAIETPKPKRKPASRKTS